MSLFFADSLAFYYVDVQQAKRWWMTVFQCKEVKIPSDWDNQLPSDVALKFPSDDEPTILLSAKAEADEAQFGSVSSTVPIIFSDNLKKAHEVLSSRSVVAGPIQSDGETEFFEIRDLEGNLIEICKDS